MNIQQAKEEIRNTLRAYHHKTESGAYSYPVSQQRPILLMGPPGVGKSAVVQQAAEESGVGFVSYTLTHHTRQSAIGLPQLVTRRFGGREETVTEYTMSEILAAVYEQMEKSGQTEGILFLDEINCVSETLAPVMLQFLQNKTFGGHTLPEGWMLVAAGNPPQYNRSVRTFDVVTLDRVRILTVEADLDAWMGYAWDRRLHPAVMTYLAMKNQHFYQIRREGETSRFVTARGWEDLSQLLRHYEMLDLPVSRETVSAFLQEEEIAESFFSYYQLRSRYGEDYPLPRLLDGELDQKAQARLEDLAGKGSFEERFSVIYLLLESLDGRFFAWQEAHRRVAALYEALDQLKRLWRQTPQTELGTFLDSRKQSQKIRRDQGQLSRQEDAVQQWVNRKLEEYDRQLRQERIRGPEEALTCLRGLFSRETEALQKTAERQSRRLERAFSFVQTCFPDGQEMVLFVSELTRNQRAMAFVSRYGCPDYLRFSDSLMTRQTEQRLQEQCRLVQELADTP